MWLSCLLAFISSACALIIELIAGRIMAPYIGVSLYTWTSVIGVVLAGMSAGNFLGGLVADRFASRRTLGLIFVAGSVTSIGILVVTDAVAGQTFDLSLLPRIVFYTAAIFLPPSLVLGMVSPMVVKLALASLERTGNTVGTIYAFSTAGSIVGTFLTGFWLISWLGTRHIVWLVAGVLFLTGIAIGQFHQSVKTLGAPALAMVVFAFVRQGWEAGRYRASCDVESNYYCIRILETISNGRPARTLMLDHLIHSYVVLDDPTVLDYGYEQAYAALTRIHATDRAQLNTLFIGGGGYTFPRYIGAVYPSATVDVIEIDPAVTATAYDRLGLPRISRIRSFNEDARTFLIEWTDPQQYDIVFGDAFNDLSVPYHLTTVEFNRIIARRMKPDGIYLVNVIDKFEDGEFLKAYANALRGAFPYVYVFGKGEAFRPFDRNTYVLMASRRPLDREALQTVTAGQDEFSRVTPLEEARLNAYLQSGRALTLTDDFAPVDQLLAELFVERGN
jgi:spermidine synthase